MAREVDGAPARRLTHAQAADLLGVAVTTVPDLIARGDLTPGQEVGEGEASPLGRRAAFTGALATE